MGLLTSDLNTFKVCQCIHFYRGYLKVVILILTTLHYIIGTRISLGNYTITDLHFKSYDDSFWTDPRQEIDFEKVRFRISKFRNT